MAAILLKFISIAIEKVDAQFQPPKPTMTAEKPVQPKEIPILNYDRQRSASSLVLPKASAQLSQHWHHLHFEVQQQPAHDTGYHRHQMHIVTMVTSGTAINQSINGQSRASLAGQNNAFILPAGSLHRCNWEQDIEFMFVGIAPHEFARVGREIVNTDQIELVPHFATVEDALIQGILLTLKRELATQDPSAHLFVEQLKTTLVVHLLRSYGVEKVNIATYTDGLPRHKLNQVLDYIEAHLECNLELEDLAQQIGMSQFYFSRLFKQSLNITPHQYVIKQRVERAKRLLLWGELSLADIALECGFANQGHLNRHFKRLTGATPKEMARTCKISKTV